MHSSYRCFRYSMKAVADKDSSCRDSADKDSACMDSADTAHQVVGFDKDYKHPADRTQ